MIFYLDTSALLKRYKTEIGTDVVDRLFASREDLITSQYACNEVMSVATRALKGRVFDEDTYTKLLGAVTLDMRDRFMPWPMSPELMWRAMAETMAYGLRAADGLHITSALSIMEYADASDFFGFVASDRELVNASRAAGMPTLDPEAPDAMKTLEAWGV